MIDQSLLAESNRLNNNIVAAIESSKEELNRLMVEIEELNVKLQSKDMRVDRSENADFQIANDSRAMKVATANLLNKRIESMSQELKTYIPTGFITLGTTVEIKALTVDGKPKNLPKDKFLFKLVQHDTGDSLQSLVAIDSLVGKAIVGRTTGEIVSVVAPIGKVEYRIERIY